MEVWLYINDIIYGIEAIKCNESKIIFIYNLVYNIITYKSQVLCKYLIYCMNFHFYNGWATVVLTNVLWKKKVVERNWGYFEFHRNSNWHKTRSAHQDITQSRIFEIIFWYPCRVSLYNFIPPPATYK